MRRTSRWPAVVREALTQYLAPTGRSASGPDGFNFIASGRSKPGGPSPLSESP